MFLISISQKSIFLAHGPQSDLLQLQKLENLKNISRDGDVSNENDAYHKKILYLAEERTKLAASTATSTESIFGVDEPNP